MSISRDDLKKYMYNPELTQKQILDMIETYTEDNKVITDPSSPFMLLLESTAATSANALIETINTVRTLYPDLALSVNDLSRHLSDHELDGMVSNPGYTNVTFFVNLTDLISNGYRPLNADWVEMTIPEKTMVKVADITLTLLNDIVIKYYDSGSIFVEHKQNDNINSIKDQGILISNIITNSDGHRLIIFTCRVKQVNIISKQYTIISSEGFSKNLNITEKNKFYHLDIWYANNSTNGKVKLPLKYNQDYIDPLNPAAYLKITDNQSTDISDTMGVNISIPDIYLIEHGVSGNIFVELYETLGGVTIPLDKIPLSDFKIILGNTSKSESTAVTTNIAIIAGSDGVISNGSSGMSFEEIKKSVIYNAKGGQVIPITDYQLEFDNKTDGFELFKVSDTITERSYIATKNLSKEPLDYIKALQDVYFNTVSIELNEYLDSDFVTIKDDCFIVNSNAIFRNDNGTMKLLTQEDLDIINKMSEVVKVDYFKDHKHFYTPFHYLISRKDSITSSRVFSFDRPVIKGLQIMGINQNLSPRINTLNYLIYKTKRGYELILKMIKNEEAKALDINQLHVVIGIPLITKNTLFIQGEYDEINDVYRFEIKSDMYVNEDNYLILQNGKATTNFNFTSLSNTIQIYTYTTDMNISDNTHYLKNVIYGEDRTHSVFTYETLNVVFGKSIDYIWNKMYIDYTARRYKKYDKNIYATYESNVYDIDPETGFEFKASKDGESIEYNLLHKVNELILDTEGNPVIKHAKGDVILKENGYPEIDDLGGLVRHIDICMLDYEFLVTKDLTYQNYNEECIKQLEEYLLNILPDKNKRLLEHTTLYYRSYKSSLPVVVKINNTYFTIPSTISPNIKIAYKQGPDTVLTSNDIETMEVKIGAIIDKYLETPYIKLEELRQRIIEGLGENIISVKITNIEPSNSEYIVFKDKSKRLSLKKKLVQTDWNDFIVKYDLNVSIETF